MSWGMFGIAKQLESMRTGDRHLIGACEVEKLPGLAFSVVGPGGIRKVLSWREASEEINRVMRSYVGAGRLNERNK